VSNSRLILRAYSLTRVSTLVEKGAMTVSRHAATARKDIAITHGGNGVRRFYSSVLIGGGWSINMTLVSR
jgi:hypothetical protein